MTAVKQDSYQRVPDEVEQIVMHGAMCLRACATIRFVYRARISLHEKGQTLDGVSVTRTPDDVVWKTTDPVDFNNGID
jgi:hypothetical protein